MKRIIKRSPLLKDAELRYKPVVIRVEKFNPEAAKEFADKIELAHNTGQPVIPVVIDGHDAACRKVLFQSRRENAGFVFKCGSRLQAARK